MRTEVDVRAADEVGNKVHKRRLDIEALRALAVGGVIASHFNVGLLAGGFAGVDVFFVISGFLITGRLLEDSAVPLRRRLIDFYARRVRRILPAATFVLIATALLAAFVQNPYEAITTTSPDIRSAAMFIVNRSFVFRGTNYLLEAGAPSIVQQYWSLSVEEQFYAIWPLLLGLGVGLGALVFGSRQRLNLAIACCVGVVGLSFVMSVRTVEANPIPSFFLINYRAWELGVGALLATIPVLVARIPRRAATKLMPTGLAAILATFLLVDRETTWPGFAVAIPVLATAIVIAAGNIGEPTRVHKVLGNSVVQLIGRWSFSLYLWHWPILLLFTVESTSVVTRLVAFAVTIVAAGLTFRWVEQPARNWRWLQTHAGATLALGAIAIALGIAVASLPTAIIGDLHSGQPAAKITRAIGSAPSPTPFVPSNMQPSLINGRSSRDRFAEIRNNCKKFGACTYGDTESDFDVVLFGDSFGGHWSAALDTLGRERGWRITRLTRSGCRSTMTGDSTLKEMPKCVLWARSGWETIRQVQPEVVILSNRWVEQQKHDGPNFETEVANAIALSEGPSRIIVLSQTPLTKDDPLGCLADHLTSALACGAKPSDRGVARANVGLRAASTNAGAYFADLIPVMCADDFCPAIDGNVLVYRETSHVTSVFARSLAGDFGSQIDAALAQLTQSD